jgi:hypothetical protein
MPHGQNLLGERTSLPKEEEERLKNSNIPPPFKETSSTNSSKQD